MALSAVPSVTIIEKVRNDRCCLWLRRGEKEYTIMDKKSNLLYSAKEELDACCRQMSCLCRRDFELDVVRGKATSGNSEYTFLHHRLCCSWFNCMACCRHRMTITRANKGVEKIGYVEQQCRICCTCWPKFSVYDEKGEYIYEVGKDADCWAYCCGSKTKCCCCSCVIPAGVTIRGQAGRDHSEILKAAESRALVSNEDTFNLTFPKGSSEDERILLVAATMLVDYAMYDDEPTNAPKAESMK
jgi:Scramblase